MAPVASRGARRALSLTMTALLLGVGMFAPAASALGEGLPVPAVVDRAITDAGGLLCNTGGDQLPEVQIPGDRKDWVCD